MWRFWCRQQLGGSGVLATVAAGLYVSWNGPLLIPAATRLQGIFFWDLVVYLLEGFVFLVTGMQMRTVLDRDRSRNAARLPFTILIVLVVIVAARFIWAFPSAYLPRWLIPPLARRDPAPPWQWAVPAGLPRRTRRRLARRGARYPADDNFRRAFSRPRPYSFRHFRCHHRHVGRARPFASGGRARAGAPA